jgi:arabinofuranan 3-O-arabinosyltransferase
LANRERGRSALGTGPAGPTAVRSESGPTVSARGPGGPEPDPPTARIPFRKRPPRPAEPRDDMGPGGLGGDDTGRGEGT